MIARTALLALALSACAVPPVEDAPVQPSGQEVACDLKVDFASIGTGIDSATLQKVEALLSGDTGVATVDRKRWGMEGEVTLCADTRTDADADRLFGAVKAIFPASSAKPLRVETGSGKAYQAPAP